MVAGCREPTGGSGNFMGRVGRHRLVTPLAELFRGYRQEPKLIFQKLIPMNGCMQNNKVFYPSNPDIPLKGINIGKQLL